MTPDTIYSIAALAAFADGRDDPAEQVALAAVGTRLGVQDADGIVRRAREGGLVLDSLVAQLPDAAAREAAYETALAVCMADGDANARETAFLASLHNALGLDVRATGERQALASGLAASGASPGAAGAGAPSDAELDELILSQAKLTAALELLPDRLANLGILPLQTRLVYRIGQRYGMQLDARQVTDLIGALGIGAVAQSLESAVRKTLGGVAGMILGGLLGGAGGVAAGAAVTFSATYALGHAAKQYYAQGRTLSVADLRALFTRFQGEAQALFPQLQQGIQAQAGSLDLKKVLAGLR